MKYHFLFFLFFANLTLSVGQQTVGLFQNDSLASDGYTLLGNNETTYLIDQCGFVVNTWESDFDSGASMYLLENGNLLRTAKINGAFNAGGVGGRFELFNWEGELIWHYEYANELLQSHHDIEPLPNGNLLALVWEKIPASEAQQNGRKYDGDVWSEKIIEIEMTGTQEANIVWEWRLWNHLIQDHDSSKNNFGNISEHPELVDLNFIGEDENTSGDWIHLNAIAYHPSLDQIAVSSRNFSEIWIIDHSTTTEEATTHFGGKPNRGGTLLYRYGNPQTYQHGTAQNQLFFKQHDIRWVPDDNPRADQLMIFNNENTSSTSSIEIWNPPLTSNGNYELESGNAFGPTSTDWSYTHDDFFSKNMSGAHLLPNGNIFITEGRTGRLFEITIEKETVWEYINPVNKNGSPTIQGGTVHFNDIFRATKYPADYQAFTNKDMTAGNPIELNPWESDCDTSHVIVEPIIGLEISILGNPVNELLEFEAKFSNKNIQIQLFDMIGNLIFEEKINEGLNNVNVANLSSGIYLLRFFGERQSYETFKILKHKN